MLFITLAEIHIKIYVGYMEGRMHCSPLLCDLSIKHITGQGAPASSSSSQQNKQTSRDTMLPSSQHHASPNLNILTFSDRLKDEVSFMG